MRALLLLLLLAPAACGRPEPDAGERLEAAALAAGLVPSADGSPTGLWVRGSDRMCVGAPAPDGRRPVGVVLDYGPGNGCAGAGTLTHDGERLALRMGGCRVEARYDGERIVFPADVGEGCAHLCAGNAALGALRVERVSGSAGEAALVRLPGGKRPCAG